jgi:hypothetical protein
MTFVAVLGPTTASYLASFTCSRSQILANANHRSLAALRCSPASACDSSDSRARAPTSLGQTTRQALLERHDLARPDLERTFTSKLSFNTRHTKEKPRQGGAECS